MMTSLIIVGCIVAWLLAGLLACRLLLAPLYGAVDKALRWGGDGSPERIMRWVALWYAMLAIIWPLSMLYGVALTVAHRATPQYSAHVNEVERERLARELAEARQMIASFDRDSLDGEGDGAPVDHDG